MLKRYSGNLSIFERLSFKQAQRLIVTAIDESDKDLLKLRWAVTYEREGISWSEFWEEARKSEEKTRPQTADEILDELGAKMAAVGW